MSNTPSRSSLVDRLAMESLLQQYKADDHLVLSDEILLAALDGSRALRNSEWNALLDSPVTLRRMRVLEARRVARNTAQTATSQLIARLQWHSSQALLLAAAGDDDGDFSQASEDGRWMLYALRTGETTRLVLKLQTESEEGDALLAARPEVAVLDGSGNTLMLGALDEDGELTASWPHRISLRSHLAANGLRWTVERV